MFLGRYLPVSWVLCDRRISLRVKGKVYKGYIYKTSNDVRCRDMGSEESTREKVGCGRNEDDKIKGKKVKAVFI